MIIDLYFDANVGAVSYTHLFELPLVTWLLSLLGLVHKTFLRKYRRHAVVIIVISCV